MGLGFNLYNENAGVFLRTALKGSYAYHLPMNDDDNFLDFGLSVGIMSERIDYKKVNADLSDPSITMFNNRKSYVDGDFGIAYRNTHFTGEYSLPNLKRFLNKDLISNTIDRSLYMAALGYRFYGKNLTIESKAMYRGVENYKDILDIAVQLHCMDNKLFLNSIYHSTNSITYGVDTFYQNNLGYFVCTQQERLIFASIAMGNLRLHLSIY